MIVSLEKPDLNELAHYGVLGMKWGVRKDRYTKGRARSRKNQTKDQEPKLTYFERTRDGYIKRGYSKTDAEALAQRKAVIRHRALIAGGVTLAVGTAFAVRHYLIENKNISLTAGQKAWHISRGEIKDLEPGRSLYVTIGQADRFAFRNRLNNPLKLERVERTFEVVKDVKIPSEKESRRLFNEFFKNPNNHKTLTEVFQPFGAVGEKPTFSDYKSFVATGPYFSSGESWHKRFSNNPAGEKLWAEYKNFLVDKGYQGILDANDRWNGFNVERPSILFDAASTLKEVSRKTIKNPTGRTASIPTIREIESVGAFLTGYAAVVATSSTSTTNKVLDAYRKVHPNSKKTNSEIIKELGWDRDELKKLYEQANIK